MQRNSRRPNVLCWRMLPAPLLFRTKIFRRLVLWGCHHGDIGRRSQCTCSKIGNLRNKHARSITLLLDVQQNIIRFQITVDQNRGKMFHAVKHALHDIECAVTSLADRNDAIFNSFIQVLAKIAYRSAAEVRHHDGEATVDRARTQRMRNVLCCRVGGERIKCRFLDHEVLHLNLREFRALASVFGRIHIHIAWRRLGTQAEILFDHDFVRCGRISVNECFPTKTRSKPAILGVSGAVYD